MWVLLQMLPEGFKELAPSLEAEVSPADGQMKIEKKQSGTVACNMLPSKLRCFEQLFRQQRGHQPLNEHVCSMCR